jgi:polysaccharide export outer membrane protein
MTRSLCVVAVAALVGMATPQAQAPAVPPAVTPPTSYVVGPQDVLVITAYDQPELTGKFTVEADGTFTYPLLGRVRAGNLTLRDVEAALKKELIAKDFLKDPQIAVAVEQYRSQKIYIVGEVRAPGAYPLSGNMRLVEALALAGSTLPTASGEVVISRADAGAIVIAPSPGATAPSAPLAPRDDDSLVRVDLRALQNGLLSQNVELRNGDSIFVLPAENVYVFGQVRNPGAYPLRQRDTTVLQALSLAGGVTDRGATGRIRIVRIVDGKKTEVRAKLTDVVLPRDTVVVPERFF